MRWFLFSNILYAIQYCSNIVVLGIGIAAGYAYNHFWSNNTRISSLNEDVNKLNIKIKELNADLASPELDKKEWIEQLETLIQIIISEEEESKMTIQSQSRVNEELEKESNELSELCNSYQEETNRLTEVLEQLSKQANEGRARLDKMEEQHEARPFDQMTLATLKRINQMYVQMNAALNHS